MRFDGHTPYHLARNACHLTISQVSCISIFSFPLTLSIYLEILKSMNSGSSNFSHLLLIVVAYCLLTPDQNSSSEKKTILNASFFPSSFFLQIKASFVNFLHFFWVDVYEYV